MAFARNIFLVLLFISIGAHGAAAQVCGGSQKPIYIYVRDGFTLKNPRYELIPVSPTGHHYDDRHVVKFVSRTFFPDDEPKVSNFWGSKSFVISPTIVEPFLKTYRPADYDPGADWRPIKTAGLSGKIEGGLIVFPTGELYSFPYLLKIFADDLKPVYILGAHLGGCYPLDRVMLDESGSRVVSEQRRGRSIWE